MFQRMSAPPALLDTKMRHRICPQKVSPQRLPFMVVSGIAELLACGFGSGGEMVNRDI